MFCNPPASNSKKLICWWVRIFIDANYWLKHDFPSETDRWDLTRCLLRGVVNEWLCFSTNMLTTYLLDFDFTTISFALQPSCIRGRRLFETLPTQALDCDDFPFLKHIYSFLSISLLSLLLRLEWILKLKPTSLTYLL